MKNITEKFNDKLSISQMIEQHQVESNIDESLKDVFVAVKAKFKQVWQWAKRLVVKIGTYVLPVNNEGEPMPAITPMTAGVAWREGVAKDAFTFVSNAREESKISGFNLFILYSYLYDILLELSQHISALLTIFF